ncbi:hypothetical protein OT109_06610 [Phycisphaeraceae bacterium D3-23]
MAEVSWGEFKHPCGFDQREVPMLLIQTQSSDSKGAMDAAHRLWNVVAHQGNACDSAIPTTLFLMELFEGSLPLVQQELMDILFQFSVHFQDDGWGSSLLDTFERYEEKLIDLYQCEDEELRSCAEMILAQMMLAYASLLDPVGLRNRDLALEVSGEPSKRKYVHPFKDHAANIISWIAESPGLSSREPVIDVSDWRVYKYPARHNSQWANVRVSPTNEEAIIDIYWS